MKKLFLSLAAIVVTATVFAQTTPEAPVVKPTDLVEFKETVHDFGKIKQGAPVTHDFEFKNVSKQPVVIESATASCGCTTPSWPKTPITKNKTNKITAGFNAAAAGPFDKTIYVKVSGVEQPLELKIK